MPRPYQSTRITQQGEGGQPERQQSGRTSEAQAERGENVSARMGVSPEDVMDDAFVSAALMEAYNGPDAE